KLEVDNGAQEAIRDLGEDSRTVSGLGLSTNGTTVLKVLKRGETGLDDVPAGVSPEGGNECHTARVVLVRRVVQSTCAQVVARLRGHLTVLRHRRHCQRYWVSGRRRPAIHTGTQRTA